jgi:hypothetical protein
LDIVWIAGVFGEEEMDNESEDEGDDKWEEERAIGEGEKQGADEHDEEGDG